MGALPSSTSLYPCLPLLLPLCPRPPQPCPACAQIITREASTRVAQYAFEFARREGRKKVTAVHKANIMKLADGLFIK